MRIFAIISPSGRRSYRCVVQDARGAVSCYLPARVAQRALRNLGASA